MLGLLLLANGLYFAWTQGWLAFAGLVPQPLAAVSLTEAAPAPLHPERIEWLQPGDVTARTATPAAPEPPPTPPAIPAPLAEELPATVSADANAVNAQTPAEAQSQTGNQPQSQAQAAPAAPPETPARELPRQCMALGSFTDAQMEPLREVLLRWPQQSWRLERSSTPARWMVFWGGMEDELMLTARRAELESKRIAYERLRGSNWGEGYSLGRFSSEAAAQQQKRSLEGRGIGGVQVVVEREEGTLYTIQFPDYEAVRADIRRDLGRFINGRSLRPC
ncbi:SPOR domain-containing protein [Corticibacter populi]|uniref:SPOR domain-containing protein n=1 Tax=Corticibacter populi TaxID=1550736 RepID=UPI0013EE5855|nr:SPOR domain-containing protein [Corticibacter populi]